MHTIRNQFSFSKSFCHSLKFELDVYISNHQVSKKCTNLSYIQCDKNFFLKSQKQWLLTVELILAAYPV